MSRTQNISEAGGALRRRTPECVESLENLWFALQFNQRRQLLVDVRPIERLTLALDHALYVDPVLATTGERLHDDEVLGRARPQCDIRGVCEQR